MNYVPDIRFTHSCRYCRHKFTASSKIVLTSIVGKHLAECGPKTRKRVKDERAAADSAAAQGDLFGERK